MSITWFPERVGESSINPLRSHVSGLNMGLGFLVLCGLVGEGGVGAAAGSAVGNGVGAGLAWRGEGVGLAGLACLGAGLAGLVTRWWWSLIGRAGC